MIEWVIDWEAFERWPKHIQEEIVNCKHDWTDMQYTLGYEEPYRNCCLCGVEQADKQDLLRFYAEKDREE